MIVGHTDPTMRSSNARNTRHSHTDMVVERSDAKAPQRWSEFLVEDDGVSGVEKCGS